MKAPLNAALTPETNDISVGTRAPLATTSPVFIVGVPRSGTSRLYLALEAHARFKPTCSPSGFDLTESRVFLNPTSIRERQGKAWDYLLHDEEEHAALVRLLPPAWTGQWRMPAVLRRQADRSRWARGVEWGSCRNDAALRTFFSHAARARGVQRIVEKTPDHIHRLPEILSAFPEAQILCMIRHPLDVYSSYRRRLGVALQTEPADSASVRWLQSVGPQTFCQGYRATISQSQRLAARLLLMRYEDFTATPQETFARICLFLGEEYDSRCVEQRTPSLDFWQQDPLLAGPIRENDKLWSDSIDVVMGRSIEDRLAGTMRQLGYNRYT
ncbi:MAG: sulfotransferase [Planctomycetes bacterium]|nr:sulfotransferase [Planctomycetota bacterium]